VRESVFPNENNNMEHPVTRSLPLFSLLKSSRERHFYLSQDVDVNRGWREGERLHKKYIKGFFMHQV
jgi:hypothetical protein